MRFYTPDECKAWLTGRERSKPEEVEGCLHLRISYPREPYRMFYIAHWIATELACRMPTLLWVTEWGIWPSSENWHLTIAFGNRTATIVCFMRRPDIFASSTKQRTWRLFFSFPC